MTEAYILVKVDAGSDETVMKQIQKIAGVKHATLTYGIFDVHVEVSFATMEELDHFVFQDIRRIPGVKETATLIAPKVK